MLFRPILISDCSSDLGLFLICLDLDIFSICCYGAVFFVCALVFVGGRRNCSLMICGGGMTCVGGFLFLVILASIYWVLALVYRCI